MRRQVNSRYITHLRTPDGVRYTPKWIIENPWLEDLVDRILLLVKAKWLKKSGVPDKLFEAAQLYDSIKKYKKSFECYLQASQLGHIQATYELALCYDFPKGCEQDLSKAFQLCLDLAKKGHVDAMCRVGMYFEHGIGTYKDSELAIFWYTEAVQKGNKLAKRNLEQIMLHRREP